MKILITGGTGFIGSHAVLQMARAGYEVLIVDNYSNSHPIVLERLRQLLDSNISFIEGDIRDTEFVGRLFSNNDIYAVIHFAGLKAVGESVEQPLKYYRNNVEGTLNLLNVMAENSCKKIVFSSSATVYGDPASVPINESFSLSATNPYGQSKLMVENILRDLSTSDPEWQVSILRYFNPVGAHQSGLIGEDPLGIPNNLMPFVAQVAVGQRDKLSVFGGDYDTVDGTGVRDYIHVEDLAAAHLSALEILNSKHGCKAYNIGTGKGYSVLEVVSAFAEVSGQDIPYEIVARRPGDIAECYADPAFSENALGWKAKHDLKRMVEDHWRWQSKNPNGYE